MRQGLKKSAFLQYLNMLIFSSIKYDGSPKCPLLFNQRWHSKKNGYARNGVVSGSRSPSIPYVPEITLLLQ